MNRILVATDGSEGADRAVDYAAQLAKSRGVELVIVTVAGGFGMPDEISRAFTRTQHAWFEELVSSMSAQTLKKARERVHALGVTNVHLESRSGEAAQTIIDIAREKGADTIVVGKRGNGRVAGLLLGSVSQKLVSLAPVAVIVVP